MAIDHLYVNLTGGAWLRGNLHAHSTRSDGSNAPQKVLDIYAGLGYDFLAMSDHDTYAGAAEYAELDAKGLILIPGNEVTAGGPHMLHIGGAGFVPPGERQTVLDVIAATSGFAVVNHPSWQEHFNHCPIEMLREWRGYAGMEIFNGVIGRLEGSAYALDKWDMLLSDGRHVLGFANDDSHADGDYGNGWIMAYARERSAAAVVEAIKSGRFYASTGVVIEEIGVDGDRIRVAAANAQRVVAVADNGRRVAVADGPSIEITAPAGCRYVRFECWGVGEAFAWTQPFYMSS